jgi:hypothetical protein
MDASQMKTKCEKKKKKKKERQTLPHAAVGTSHQHG